MRRLFFAPHLAILSLFLGFSCSEKQDFNQFNDLNVTPTVASSIFYLESTEEHINSLGSGINFYAQTPEFRAFSEEFVAENILQGTITYEIENTTSKNLRITVEFLDSGGNVLDVQSFSVEAAPAPLLSVEIFYGPGGKNINILRATTSLRINGINLSGSTSTSTLTNPKAIFKSAGEFIFKIK